jgi:hypothetical protein
MPMYMLIDPPVTPFSRPEEILRWIDDLKALRADPANAPCRAQVDDALSEARSYLSTSRRLAKIEHRVEIQPNSRSD